MSPYSSGASSSNDFILQTLEKSRVFFAVFRTGPREYTRKGLHRVVTALYRLLVWVP